MDVKNLSGVFARLRPFIRDQVVRRSRLERVLGTFDVPADVFREEVERLLSEAGIAIEEDAPAQSPRVTLPKRDAVENDDPPRPADVDKGAAVRAARRRLEQDRYIKNPAKVLLRAEEEVGLAILVRGQRGAPLGQGDFGRLTGEARRAAECLLLHNQGLVWSFAQRFAPPGMTYEDLCQHGMCGLIRAVELFDPTQGYKFSTYAMNWVRQAITRAIANESRLIRLPVHMVERVQKVWATRSRLTIEGEPPAVHQLALACELSDEETAECLALGPQYVLSLDTPVGTEGESTLADLLDVGDPDLSPEYEVGLALMKAQVRAVVAGELDEREAGIISLRFGIGDGEPRTLDEIGQVYGVTRERIRQIERKSMDKLRRPAVLTTLGPYIYGGETRIVETENSELAPA